MDDLAIYTRMDPILSVVKGQQPSRYVSCCRDTGSMEEQLHADFSKQVSYMSTLHVQSACTARDITRSVSTCLHQ